MVSFHRLFDNHEFDWEHIKILNYESSIIKKNISEITYIKKQSLDLNKQNNITQIYFYPISPSSSLPLLDFHLFPNFVSLLIDEHFSHHF